MNVEKIAEIFTDLEVREAETATVPLPLYRRKQSVFELVKAFRKNPGMYLRLMRAAKNWTMEEGATVIGVTRQTWAGWETGEREIKMIHLESLVTMWMDTWEVIE